MRYYKNRVTITGKIVLLGTKHENIPIVLLDCSKESVIPIYIEHLQIYVKLNSIVTVSGELAVVNGFHYIKADTVESTRSKLKMNRIELTGLVSKSLSKSEYNILIGEKVFNIEIPIKDKSIIKMDRLSNVKLEYRTPVFMSKKKIELNEAVLICTNYTSL